MSKRSRKQAKRTSAAVVMAWRRGETEVQATVESAVASIERFGGSVIPVEDRTKDGPARTRHRGIMAADGSDVIIIVDPHMRFKGDALSVLAERIMDGGGLVCAKCYHNPECSFDAPSWYAGATIARRAQFASGERNALCWKWATDTTPGPRPCVGGACYAFRRDWYLDVGMPLAALPGWGCDEESLSISAWYSGHMPEVIGVDVAHRWRSSAPWQKTLAEKRRIWQSRVSMIEAVVTHTGDKDELIRWQTEWLNAIERKRGVQASDETRHWAAALRKQPRGWEAWRSEVMGADAIETAIKQTVAKAVPAPVVVRAPRQTNLTAIMPVVVCPSCHHEHDAKTIPVLNSYPEGRRRHRCEKCGRAFITVRRVVGRCIAGRLD